MENCVRTAQAALLQSCQFLAKNLPIKANTTLNEKFNIQPTVAPAETDYFSMKYAVIGNGGHTVAIGPNNGSSGASLSTPVPVMHTPRHTALYNHLPFALRLPNQDLPAAQRAGYRMRRLEQHDGKTYVAYYAKVLDLSQTLPTLEYRTVKDGATTSTEYIPTLGDLSPTPPALTTGTVITTSADYVAATAKINFTLAPSEIDELLNVSNIIYGSENYAIISEIGMVAGVDRQVSGDFNGISASYTEVIGARVTHFISSFFSAKFNNGSISAMLDIGSLESLLVSK